MAAVLGTFASVALIDLEVGTVVLGVAMAVSLSRSQLERDRRGRLEAGIALPVIGAASAAVGYALVELPWLGAGLYVAGLTASVLLRVAGPLWRRIGGLLAIPFVALLIAPVGAGARFGAVGAALAPIVVGVVAWAWVTVLQVGAQRLGLLPDAAAPASAVPARPPRRGTTMRLAAQQAATLVLAFGVGFVFFADRWTWVVLTAVIVSVGNRGRADIVDKAVHRVLGSAAATLLVFLPAAPWSSMPVVAAVVALTAVFVGVLLRDLDAAWWAAAVTVALSIVQQLGGSGSFLLLQRWEEIAVGALIAVVVGVLLLPVPTADVVRSRIAALLAAVSEVLVDAATADALARPLRELDAAARPFDDLRRIGGGRRLPVSQWIGLARECAGLAPAAAGDRAGGGRRAIGAARRAVADPAALAEALRGARDALAAASGR